MVLIRTVDEYKFSLSLSQCASVTTTRLVVYNDALLRCDEGNGQSTVLSTILLSAIRHFANPKLKRANEIADSASLTIIVGEAWLVVTLKFWAIRGI